MPAPQIVMLRFKRGIHDHSWPPIRLRPAREITRRTEASFSASRRLALFCGSHPARCRRLTLRHC